MAKTNIEWATHSLNPIRGCTRVSEGCRNCYAERQAIRQAGKGGAYEGTVRSTKNGPRWTGQLRFAEDQLLKLQHWRKPRRIFLGSMSDLFHEEVRTEWLIKIFNEIEIHGQHTYIVLTKRPKSMYRFLRLWGPREAPRRSWDSWPEFIPSSRPLSHVWFGVSVENEATASERLPFLRMLSAQGYTTWVSYEPALRPVNWSQHLAPMEINWLVCGGESGPGARPMHPDWARAARDFCARWGVPYFFKQYGHWAPCSVAGSERTADKALYVSPSGKTRPASTGARAGATTMQPVGKKAAGRLLDGREWNQYPSQGGVNGTS